MTEAQKVDALWSVHAIRQLAYRFAQAHDSRDMREMERIFLSAAEPLAFPDFNLANVRSTLPAYWRVAVRRRRLSRTTSSISSTTITERAAVPDRLAKLDIGGTWIEQAILYQDAYERHDGVWRFAKRRHLLWYGIELPERPFDQPKTQWPAGATGRGSLPQAFESWRGFYGITEPPSGYYSQPDEASAYA